MLGDKFSFSLLQNPYSFPGRSKIKFFFLTIAFEDPQVFPLARQVCSIYPASRLVIAVEAVKKGGDDWVWPFTHGKRAFLSMNRL